MKKIRKIKIDKYYTNLTEIFSFQERDEKDLNVKNPNHYDYIVQDIKSFNDNINTIVIISDSVDDEKYKFLSEINKKIPKFNNIKLVENENKNYLYLSFETFNDVKDVSKRLYFFDVDFLIYTSLKKN